MRKLVALSVVVSSGLCLLVSLWIGRANAAEATAPVVWAAADVKWSDSPALKGAKVAVLWGDPKTGPYGTLKTLPGGASLALHTHTYDQRAIVLSGTVILTFEGGAAKDLGPGSYALIPGGAKHKADCKAGAECVYFEEATGAADIKFVPAPDKK